VELGGKDRAMAADSRYNINSQIEHLQMRYVGTGHADISKFEWIVHQHRDMYASFIGHNDISAYYSIAQNESLGRVRYQMLMKMIKPCGEAPKEEES